MNTQDKQKFYSDKETHNHIMSCILIITALLIGMSLNDIELESFNRIFYMMFGILIGIMFSPMIYIKKRVINYD